jgi:hypothetical protein
MRNFDLKNLPPELRGAALVPAAMVPLVTDTWQCSKGHIVKTSQGQEPRLMLGPGIGTPKPVCLMCLLTWMSDTFPLVKQPEPEPLPQEERPSGLIVPG